MLSRFGLLEINACAVSNGLCHANATCTDLAPPSVTRNCTCNTGYVGDGLNCTGDDEVDFVIVIIP